MALFIALLLKSGGYIGFGLSVIPAGRHNSISAQYLKKKLTEFHRVLYMYMHLY